MKRSELSERTPTPSRKTWSNMYIFYPSILLSPNISHDPLHPICIFPLRMNWLSVNTIINKGSCFLQLNLCPNPSTRHLKLHKWMRSLLISMAPMSKMWVSLWIRSSGRNMEESLCRKSRGSFIILSPAIMDSTGPLKNGKLMRKKRKIVGRTLPSISRPASRR